MYHCFTFDFKSLYDSLDPNLVIEALQHAMNTSRPGSNELRNWILALIDFSLRASVAKYEGSWYKQNNGIPTGGSLCVQLANITVFYVMNKKVYSQANMMREVYDAKRYIDDGVGLFIGNEEQFNYWLKVVNAHIGLYGLTIDESNFKKPTEYINVLDIQFCFDITGELQTDLYIKETDSRSYLNFSSAHPNHVFSGTVYAQCLRLRRIINDDERLSKRLDDLAVVFKEAGYPSKMIMDIKTKVLHSERDVSVKDKVEMDDDRIRVISTYKADEHFVNCVKKSEESFKHTHSFRNVTGKLFTYVKKVGPNIKCQVNNLKRQALGTEKGGVKKCKGHGCKCCKMLNSAPFTMVNGRKVRLASGTCKSSNICYLAVCELCNKPYTGRTVDEMHNRVNGHRHMFREVLKKSEENNIASVDTDNDLYTLGLHLHLEHGCIHPNDFDRYFRFSILEVVSPSNINVKEFKWMHKLNSFQPIGINVEYPFGLPYLGQK